MFAVPGRIETDVVPADSAGPDPFVLANVWTVICRLFPIGASITSVHVSVVAVPTVRVVQFEDDALTENICGTTGFPANEIVTEFVDGDKYISRLADADGDGDGLEIVSVTFAVAREPLLVAPPAPAVGKGPEVNGVFVPAHTAKETAKKSTGLTTRFIDVPFH